METVKVAVRVRPMVSSEKERGCQVAVVRVRGQPQIILNNEPFTFNYVFDATDSQIEFFESAILPMLDNLYEGFNVTILAYGQTGSGKTFTMGTAFNGELNEDAGVIPRAINYIFEKNEKLSEKYYIEIKCSFLELYQEQLYDLLTNKTREQSIVEIREDRNGICIPDLTYEVVNSPQETTDLLMRGSTGRAVASTAMNEHSSRSHAIFTIIITSTKKDDSQAVTTAKFHLVDLAGSERSKKTKATGDRFKEGVKINHGLLALGNVISALGSEKKSNFVQYRDSKLTRLLQDSLGGNSITLMIACVSPADYNVPETLSTLRYADRAKKIKNKPVVNQDPHAAEINNLKNIIQKLRLELLAIKGGSDSSLELIANEARPSPKKNILDKMFREQQEKYRNLQHKLQKTLHDVMENEMRVHIAEAAQEKLQEKIEQLKVCSQDLLADMKDSDEHKEKVEKIVHMTIEINEDVERSTIEINEQKQQSALNVISNSDNEVELSEEGSAEIEKQGDEYNNKQFKFKEQLCRINHELNLKEQLQQRLANNLNKFSTIEVNVEEKCEEFTKKIKALEDEKADLLDKLHHVKENTSAKLAEDRRKRLQMLEHEIHVMKTKIKQQSNLLKVREKESQKILNLNKEIQSMKESKVKLIRTMRQEAENFRQWKLTREKELIQIKNKGRKMESEMARKEALHTKQRNVLKRKCEEALAINKRLKDALERQSAAQVLRQKLQSNKDGNTIRTDQVISVVDRELEVISSLVEAEQSLEHLMEDRGIINGRIVELRVSDPMSDELKQLEEEFEMRNAQITELQQKVCSADLNSRMKALSECIQNMSEARVVIKQLLNTICDTQREYANRLQEQKVVLDEKRIQLQVLEGKWQKLIKREEFMEKEHQDKLIAIERTYEEKIALLLSELHSKSTALLKREINGENAQNTDILTSEQNQCLQIEEDLYTKIASMREEIEQYKQIISEMKASKAKRMNRSTESEKLVDIIELESDDDCFELSSLDDDPDWEEPPLARKRKHLTLRRKNNSVASNNSTNTKSSDDTFATASNQSNRALKKKPCKCRSHCKTKHCGCRAVGVYCDNSCLCGESCSNGNTNSSVFTEPDDRPQTSINKTFDIEGKENTEIIPDVLPEKRPKSDEALLFPKPMDEMDEKSRKMLRLTTISFNTPTSKKKFFG